ncbi:hypothetical protein BS50DRAFT_583957 [Corynespora cassiicola Philippines]|uniref:Uncharacterized protein n=1 Tax=Corynespora cassiicola Philippines TaxID=1448308 RepID=A0A2T2P459_CORCC|nr:hypothetical protein BS50DRAFT_583957 [Corynespora cassiicola Philippines]
MTPPSLIRAAHEAMPASPTANPKLAFYANSPISTAPTESSVPITYASLGANVVVNLSADTGAINGNTETLFISGGNVVPEEPIITNADNDSSTYHFVMLPAEFRNIIYEYALTANEGILCLQRRHQSINIVERMTGFPPVFSRLKWTSKLIHEETKFLELEFNKLSSPEKKFLEYIREVKVTSFQSHLRHVLLFGDMETYHSPPQEVLHTLLNVARSNSNMRLDITLPDWRINGRRMDRW